MTTIDIAFENLMHRWNDMPKGLKTKYYQFRYKHIRNIQRCGMLKKIEMLEAAGYTIGVTHSTQVKPLLTTPEDVFKHICLNWDDYPKEFEAEDAPFMKAFIKDPANHTVTTFRINKMIERAGFKRIYTK